jgi:hypothetical protein
MNSGNPIEHPIAAVFDLRQPASLEAMRKVAGAEKATQFEQPGKPLVVLVLYRPDVNFARIAFENESQLLAYYLITLRGNAMLEPRRRVQFVLRDLAPDLENALRQATQELARELGGSAGPA